MPKSAQRQSLVKVAGIDGYFATKTGGDTEGEVSLAYDGGKAKPEKLSGPPVVGEVVVSRTYDPLRDAALEKELRKKVGRWYTTVSVQPTDADLVALPVPPTVYTNALLRRVVGPEHDASSGDPQVLELTFDPEDTA